MNGQGNYAEKINLIEEGKKTGNRLLDILQLLINV